MVNYWAACSNRHTKTMEPRAYCQEEDGVGSVGVVLHVLMMSSHVCFDIG